MHLLILEKEGPMEPPFLFLILYIEQHGFHWRTLLLSGKCTFGSIGDRTSRGCQHRWVLFPDSQNLWQWRKNGLFCQVRVVCYISHWKDFKRAWLHKRVHCTFIKLVFWEKSYGFVTKTVLELVLGLSNRWGHLWCGLHRLARKIITSHIRRTLGRSWLYKWILHTPLNEFFEKRVMAL